MKLSLLFPFCGLVALFYGAYGLSPAASVALAMPGVPAASPASGQEDDLEEADLGRLNTLLEIDPKNVAAYLVRGNIYVGKELWSLAQEDYAAVLRIDPYNVIAKMNLAEIRFRRKQYDAARVDYLALAGNQQIGDLAGYKILLCDLLAAHETMARQDLAALDAVGENASYYFGNIAWDLVHHDAAAARQYLASAEEIYPRRKVQLYAASLLDLGYLPLPDTL